MQQKINQYTTEISNFTPNTAEELENFRIKFLGTKGLLKDLFDEFFVYKGLDELIPVTENDFISFKDTVLDKFGRQGYLKYIGSYYIFQHHINTSHYKGYYKL